MLLQFFPILPGAFVRASLRISSAALLDPADAVDALFVQLPDEPI